MKQNLPCAEEEEEEQMSRTDAQNPVQPLPDDVASTPIPESYPSGCFSDEDSDGTIDHNDDDSSYRNDDDDERDDDMDYHSDDNYKKNKDMDKKTKKNTKNKTVSGIVEKSPNEEVNDTTVGNTVDGSTKTTTTTINNNDNNNNKTKSSNTKTTKTTKTKTTSDTADKDKNKNKDKDNNEETRKVSAKTKKQETEIARHDDVWKIRMSQLVAHLDQHSAWPQYADIKSSPLYKWLSKVRAKKREGNLAPERVKQLEDLGFTWSGDHRRIPFDRSWLPIDEDENPSLDIEIPETVKSGNWNESRHDLYWKSMFPQLLAYLEEHKVWPSKDKGSTMALYTWLCSMRGSYRAGKLSPERAKQLEDLGFLWYGYFGGIPYRPPGSDVDVDTDGEVEKSEHTIEHRPNETFFEYRHRAHWNKMFPQLMAHLEKHKVWPQKKNPKAKSLYVWLCSTRDSYRAGKLTAEEVKLLDDLGYAWEGVTSGMPFRPGQPPLKQDDIERSNTVYTENGRVYHSLEEKYREQWEEDYSKLTSYLGNHKTWPSPGTPESTHLYNWLKRQRNGFRRGQLSPDEMKRLNDLGFPWEGNLQGIPFCPPTPQSNNGSCADANKDSTKDNSTAILSNQNVPIHPVQFNLVQKWDRNLAAVIAYLEEHKVWPRTSPVSSKRLYTWLNKTRNKCREGKLFPDQVKRLEDLGFRWEGPYSGRPYRPRKSLAPKDGTAKDNNNDTGSQTDEPWNLFRHRQRWNLTFPKVLTYLKKHKVWPGASDPESKSMHEWLTSLRLHYRSGKLLPGEVEQLENHGFVWEGPFEGIPYRPRPSPPDDDACAIITNRGKGNNSRVPVYKLIHRKCWEAMLAKVVAYLEKKKIWPEHRAPDSRPLNLWLASMREKYRAGKLFPEQVKQLEDIGFPWEGVFSGVPYTPRRLPSSKDDGVDDSKGDDTTAEENDSPPINAAQLYRREMWDHTYAELITELEKTKLWPRKNSKRTKYLNSWLKTQRRNFGEGRLAERRKNKLDDIGFPWVGDFGGMPYSPRKSDSSQDGPTNNDAQPDHQKNPPKFHRYGTAIRKESWDKRYNELVSYLGKHKKWPKCSGRKSKPMYAWLRTQRHRKRRGKLLAREIKQLDDIGFLWEGPYSETPWHPREPHMVTSAPTDQDISVRPGQDPDKPTDDVKDNSDNRNNDSKNNHKNNKDDDYESSDDYLDDEESDYHDDEESVDDCYGQNNNDDNEGEEEIDCEKVNNNNENDQDEESRWDEWNTVKHETDSDNDDRSSCSDSSYRDSDDDEEDAAVGSQKQELYSTQQDPSHATIPVITSSSVEAQIGDELSQHNQDAIVPDRTESTVLPAQQQDAIRTTVARLPSSDEEDHQTVSGVSPLESVSLWLSNRQTQLRRVSDEKPRKLDAAGLSCITTTGGNVDQQGDVDEDDRKIAATDDNGIFDDPQADNKMSMTNSPGTVEHAVRQEPDACGSSSPGSRKRRGIDPPESRLSKKGKNMKAVAV